MILTKQQMTTILSYGKDAAISLSYNKNGHSTLGNTIHHPVICFYGNLGTGKTTQIRIRFPHARRPITINLLRNGRDINTVVFQHLKEGYFYIEHYDHSDKVFDGFLAVLGMRGIQVITTSITAPLLNPNPCNFHTIQCGYPDFIYKENRADGFLLLLTRNPINSEASA